MRVMSLFSGYGGLDHGLLSVVEGEVVAVADVDPGACRLLAHRYPGVPNLGDVTKIDWREWVGKVDAITGGTPCQDLSHAGGRAGMRDGTRSGLWVSMREAVAVGNGVVPAQAAAAIADCLAALGVVTEP